MRSIDAVAQHFADTAGAAAATEPSRTRAQSPLPLEDAVEGQQRWYEQRARDHWARMGEQGA